MKDFATFKQAVRKKWASKLFPKTSFVRRIYILIDSGWNIDGIFSVYTVWADIATGSVISLWDQDYCYGLWADETTFAYDNSILELAVCMFYLWDRDGEGFQRDWDFGLWGLNLCSCEVCYSGIFNLLPSYGLSILTAWLSSNLEAQTLGVQFLRALWLSGYPCTRDTTEWSLQKSLFCK